MKRKIKELGRNTQIIHTDSKAHSTTNSLWLQGGMMNIIRRGIVSFFNKEIVKVDKLGK